MMKFFIITWIENKKNSIQRQNSVMSTDAKSALDVFIKNFGNLKKNIIISIQEVDKNGDFIGEPIVPADETSIVPVRRKN